MSETSKMKILLVNRHMNIGGVETYLCRVIAGLTELGHEVGLLSEGGLYADKAQAAGARLHLVKSLARDWESMLQEISANGYGLVHAHNYHSARIGKKLAARLGKPYLMSVHGPRPRLKQLLFRDWSREVVVMSEGDGENISWFGGVSKSRVILSFYGIDTERFRPGIDVSKLRAELGLNEAERSLVFISRFSNRKADVGHSLLEALPSLRETYPNLRLLLVGEGPEAEPLREHVTRLNQSSPDAARMIGPRKDVESFMALADVTICTATTALEAIACGTPTIAAGRTGYFGPVTDMNFEAGRSLCFADHGVSPHPLDPKRFAADIARLLAEPKQARAEALKASHFLAERYGVKQMSLQLEGLYRRLLAGKRLAD